MNDVKYMDIAEFRDAGYLQELNRRFLHPRGLALEIVQADGNNPARFGGVWDYREDDEGMVFGERPDAAKSLEPAAELERHAEARVALMGDVIQPLDWPK